MVGIITAVVAYTILTTLALLFAYALEIFIFQTKWQNTRKMIGIILLGWAFSIIVILGIISYLLLRVADSIFKFNGDR
jgi:hypothetical protein